MFCGISAGQCKPVAYFIAACAWLKVLWSLCDGAVRVLDQLQRVCAGCVCFLCFL